MDFRVFMHKLFAERGPYTKQPGAGAQRAAERLAKHRQRFAGVTNNWQDNPSRQVRKRMALRIEKEARCKANSRKHTGQVYRSPAEFNPAYTG